MSKYFLDILFALTSRIILGVISPTINKASSIKGKWTKIKIIETKQSDAADDVKNRKIAQLQSYIRNINSELHKLAR